MEKPQTYNRFQNRNRRGEGSMLWLSVAGVAEPRGGSSSRARPARISILI